MAKRMTLANMRTSDFESFSYSQLRKAYSVYQQVLSKRIKRLSKGTTAQKRFVQPFISGSKQLRSLTELDKLPRKGWDENALRREMLFRVKELQILEQKERLSLSGWKRIEKNVINILRESGYENISKKNIKQFGEYMEKMRELFKNKIFPSEEVAEAYNTVVEENTLLGESDLLSLIDSFTGGVGVDLFL